MSGNQPGFVSEMLKTHVQTKQTIAMAGEAAKGVYGLMQIIVFAPAITIAVLTRRNFGVRYLSGARVIFGFIASGLLSTIHPFMFWCMPLFLTLVIAHHVWSARLRRRGVQIHSYSMGDHWPFFWKITKKPTMIMTIEPLMVLILGLCLIPLSTPLAVYLLLAGFGIALENSQVSEALRIQMLNAMDQRIESQQSAQLMNAQPSPQAPFQVPQPIPQGYQVGAAPTVAQAHQHLDPALKAMMEPKTAPQVYTINSEPPQNAEMFPRTATMIGGS